MPPRRRSAGLLMYRRGGLGLEVFLVHPGGPFFTGKDDGYWSIPKGLTEDGEELIDVAEREFQEETGRSVGTCRIGDDTLSLGTVIQRGGKTVYAWAFEGDWPDDLAVDSNTFQLEWPRGSGRLIEVPEVDEGRFFPLAEARRKINGAQEELVNRLLTLLEA